MADYDEKKVRIEQSQLILFDIDKGEYIELESKAEPKKDTTKKQAADNNNQLESRQRLSVTKCSMRN